MRFDFFLEPWTGFTQFTIITEKFSDGCTWSRRCRQKKIKQQQGLTILGQKFGEEFPKQLNEEKSSNGLSRNRSSTMRESREATILSIRKTLSSKKPKNARKKLELLVDAAMPCKVKDHQCRETCGESDTRRSKYACIVEAHKSTRKRLERTLPEDHEDRVAGEGLYSFSHCNLLHKFTPMPQAMKMPDEKAAVATEREKLENLPAWKMTKVKNKTGVMEEAGREQRAVHFATLMDICHLKNSELEPKFQKYKGGVVLRGDTVEDDSGSYAVFT